MLGLESSALTLYKVSKSDLSFFFTYGIHLLYSIFVIELGLFEIFNIFHLFSKNKAHE